MQTSGCGRRRATIYQNWKVVHFFFIAIFCKAMESALHTLTTGLASGAWSWMENKFFLQLGCQDCFYVIQDSIQCFSFLCQRAIISRPGWKQGCRPGENKGDCSFSPSMNDFCWQIAKETFACHVLVRWCARSNWSMVMIWRMWKKRQPLDFHKFIEKLPHGSFSTIFLLKLPCVLRLLCSLSLWGLAKQQAHGKNPIFAPRKIAM